MDFSDVALSAEDKDFRDQTRKFLTKHVTDEVLRAIESSAKTSMSKCIWRWAKRGIWPRTRWLSEGGFSPVHRRIFQLEIARAHTPWYHWGTTAMVARMVEQFGAPELAGTVLPGVLSGEIRLCLGYTEPEGGSDVATCKTRAVRDGEGTWIINGSKMFTSNAQNAQYVFLLTNTDPQGRKHQNLTMFLVPLDSPGIEIQGIRTLDGDRTNIVYYSDVRVDDRYRIGEVNGGWTVMRSALDAEHGIVDREDHGLQYISAMAAHGTEMAEAVDTVAAMVPTGTGWVAADGRRVGEIPARPRYRPDGGGASTPGMFGRVAIAQTMRDISPDLMDMLGTASALPIEAEGAVDDGATEYLFRLAVRPGSTAAPWRYSAT